MAYRDKLLKTFGLTGKPGEIPEGVAEGDDLDIMRDARYLRQSSALVNDALQKGFDVLQLANGDIVTTGTKTVVYQYTWDDSKGKLVRVKANGEPRRHKSRKPGDRADQKVEQTEPEDISS